MNFAVIWSESGAPSVYSYSLLPYCSGVNFASRANLRNQSKQSSRNMSAFVCGASLAFVTMLDPLPLSVMRLNSNSYNQLRSYTVFASHGNWLDASTRRSRQSSHDAAAAATHRRQVIRSFRPMYFDAQARVQPHAHCAASDARTTYRVGCLTRRCGEAGAVLTVR